MRFNRLNIKHFAELATNNGVFGSAQLSDDNSGVITADVDQIASLQAFREGWDSATLSAKRLPTLEEMQGLQCYFSYAINYLYQNGIALWNTNQVYFKGGQCRTYVNDKVQIWNSLVDNNTGNNPVLTTGFWEEHKSAFAEVADKLGTSNVGSTLQFIYLVSGVATASTSNLGTSTKPLYLSSGTFTVGEELAKIDLSNINNDGKQFIRDLVGVSFANVDLSNLSTTGNAKFQAPLVSGTNIKTIGGESILGSGNIAVQGTITGAATSITTSNLTTNSALVSDTNGKVAASSITSTELSYLSGVTSLIQTQINAKVAKAGDTITGTLTLSKTQAASGTADNSPALIVGGAATSTHLELDKNQIMAKATGTTTAKLYINNNGGLVTVGSGGLAVSSLTASTALVTDANKKLVSSSVTSTELGYLSGVTSAIQTQLNAKQATITGGATSIASSDLTASRALISNGSGKVAVSSVTSTELGYLSGVTANVQTQIGNRAFYPNYNNYFTICNQNNFSSVFPYTVVADGYIQIAPASNSLLSIKINGGACRVGSNLLYNTAWVPVKKGDVITRYDSSGTWDLNFIYGRT